jgi:hypothetical protein
MEKTAWILMSVKMGLLVVVIPAQIHMVVIDVPVHLKQLLPVT